tara:strand:+ start:130 stop:501 length:372 start_codon:yes stop_codon:yes gene_type:complete
VKISISLSFTSQKEIAAANRGNLIQAIPLTKEFSINKEKYEETIAIQKKNNADFTQDIFNQAQENFNVLLIKNNIAVKVINISTRDLLIIIKNGISDQITIKILSCSNFVFNIEKKSKLIFLK